MSQILLDQAKIIQSNYLKGNITGPQYFAKLASFGKKYNISVFKITTELAKS